MKNLTHFDIDGNAIMVDVSEKNISKRVAEASGLIKMNKLTLDTILNKKISKGDVLQVARIAGIMAAKQTSSIIPLCHPLIIDKVTLEFIPYIENSSILIKSQVICRGSTGVEMEAFTSVSAALLTIYDMCKSIDRGMVINEIKLETKSGGKSGTWTRQNAK